LLAAHSFSGNRRMADPFLLHITEEDKSFLPHLKSIVAGRAKVALATARPSTATEILIAASNKGIKRIATTSEVLLKLLLDGKMSKKNYYAGSIIEKFNTEFLILNPLEHLVTTNTGEFICRRFLDKFLAPQKFIDFPAFRWELFEPAQLDSIFTDANEATYTAIDIETTDEKSQERRITSVAFTFVSVYKDYVAQRTVVVPMIDEYNYVVVKNLCATRAPKVFQNGKYDVSYFIRWNIHVNNWLCDTQHLFHSWYSELPKRLDFISAFMIRKWQYWKNEIHDIETYYQYNGKDSYITAASWYNLLLEVPSYAINNYLKEFPLVYPCLMAELRGLRRDNNSMEEEEKKFTAILDQRLATLRRMVANPYYNPSSPKQTVNLLKILGSGDLTSSDRIHMDKAKARHPLNKRILSTIENYRKDRKLVGTYLRDKDPEDGTQKTWHGRIFYSLNPHGTDTGRLASKESVFWCGWQIQNIPRDREDIQVRRGILSDPGFYLGECDRSQAEVRDTAYIAGDPKLIAAVDDKTKDFHSLNASSFFGLPYDQIAASTIDNETGEWVHRILDKPIRQLSKNTNHGSNYNMGAGVMIDTMGIVNVRRAQQLLGLPSKWTPLQVTQYLLDRFSETYSVVKGAYYDKVKADVASSKLLVGPTGWTRYCFGHPDRNKRDLNALVAHPPQSLNAMELNKAYMRVFYEIALQEPEDFKLGPQIHDSILFQYRIGRLDLPFAVQRCMTNPVQITDIFGKTRTLTVPTDLKGEDTRWSELKILSQKDLKSFLQKKNQTSLN
jgi:hypothetical protein